MNEPFSSTFTYLTSMNLVSFPDPAFKLDKGLAHFAPKSWVPDLAGKE